jgi:hypothetical protein
MVAGDSKILDKVRKLLTKAENEATTPAEAEALTAKAAAWMAKYGIDQALLEATRPAADNKPTDKKFTIQNPYAPVKSNFLYNLGTAMGCTGVRLASRTGDGVVLHMFGFRSDIERTEMLWTSLLLQMAHGLAQQEIPERARRDYAGRSHVKAYRRSWMLGFVRATVARVKAVENRAKREAEQDISTGPGTALVLADRSVQVLGAMREAYPKTRATRITYSGSGYGAGYRQGQAANIGGTSVGRRSAGALR